MKQVSGSLKLELAQYNEMLSFAQFGSDLDAVTKATIEHGQRLTELLKQGQYSPLTLAEQVLSLFSAKHGFLKTVETSKVRDFERFMHAYFKNNHSEIVNEIEDKGIISDELNAKMKDAMNDCLKEYKTVYGA